MIRMLMSFIAVGILALPLPAQAPPKKPAIPDGIKAELNLEYGPHGERNTLDLYRPEQAAKPVPLVIWVHGGGWEKGSKGTGGPVLPLLTKGFAVAAINYRLTDKAVFPAQIEDCKAAVRFLRANANKFNLDADHFGVWGGSAGGHLVALLGTTGDVKELEGDGRNLGVSSRVQAVVDWFGPTDLLQLTSNVNATNSPVARLLGGPPHENKAKADKANPIRHITKDDAPFLIFHGDKDPLVPLSQSEILHEALKQAGVPCELVILKGAGHGGPQFTNAESMAKVEAFFRKHLMPAAK